MGFSGVLARRKPFPVSAAPAATGEAIRPFRIHIPEKDLIDLRHRLAATRWPEKETVADDTQGVPLATMRRLVRHWQTDYDWRKIEARLNAVRSPFRTAERFSVEEIIDPRDTRPILCDWAQRAHELVALDCHRGPVARGTRP